MAYDFDDAGLIRDVIVPKIEDAIFFKPYRELAAQFNEDSQNPGGPKITHQIITSAASNARNFTKANVDPVAGSFEAVDAYWNFTYQETAAEVFNIDINQAVSNAGIFGIENLLTKAIEMEMAGLWELIYDNVYAQIKLDLLASGTYSDAALSRVTYPVLAPYNEVTDTQITVALMRGCQYGTTLNKSNTGGYGAYRFVMEPSVFEALKPQVGLLHTWNQTDSRGSYAGGYANLGEFEGTPVSVVQGMTTGDVFFVRPQDVHIKQHRPLTFTTVPSGRDSIKVIMRTGINAWVENVGKQGMMTNKD